jgi:predicted DNA-binding transcriptional regulator AlpA
VRAKNPSTVDATRPDARRFLRPEQVEVIFGLSRKYLAHARGRGDGPPFSKAGRKVVLYSVADIEEWLAARRRQSTSDPGAPE